MIEKTHQTTTFRTKRGGRCERAEVCSFFNDQMKDMPLNAEAFKNKYCMSDKDSCARYMVHKALRQGFAPADEEMMHQIEKAMKVLTPNNTAMAGKIIGWLMTGELD